MKKWFDALLDHVSAKLAENLTSNMETVAQNKAARELSELSDPQLRKVGISRSKLEKGSEAFPWHSNHHSMRTEEPEVLMFKVKTDKRRKSKVTLVA